MVRWKGWAFVYVRDMNQAFHINRDHAMVARAAVNDQVIISGVFDGF